ncbi:MAG: glycosyltransferase family 2 protein [Myxococcota bacterium]|nr:glycosyltransferase family 2 protein [Myxococcota bacterium]
MSFRDAETKGLAPELSLVFPVLDEEDNLSELIAGACKVGEELEVSFEVIIVNDGSQDESAQIIDAWAARDPRIRPIHHASNSGYGAALRTGLSEARGNQIFFSDADLQFDLDQLRNLLVHSPDYDIVAGYRSPRRDPWPRSLIAGLWGVGVRIIFGLRIRDIDCAFKLFDRRVIETIPLASVGAFINTELLVRAQASGFRIRQVPVNHRRRRRGRQSGAHPRVLIKACLELGSLYRELRSVTGQARRRPGVR